MNIKIVDSWLREYLDTEATPKQIAEKLSLTSVSIERLDTYKQEVVYDLEVTTNRPDLASVIGIAREAGAVLPQQGKDAEYKPLVIDKIRSVKTASEKTVSFHVENDPSLVHRICAVVLEVVQKSSPTHIVDRLEASGIRSINNIVDITNYVMRGLGQPTHVMDYDRLGDYIKIREAKKGEAVITLDGKAYSLTGGDIVGVNKKNEIVDLIGIMGLQNSVVTDTTKRIVFFINNVEADKVRQTSMLQGIRTEAVQLNEKHLDPNLCIAALMYGIDLYKQFADAKIVSDIIDIYPNPQKTVEVSVTQEHINRMIGIPIPLLVAEKILRRLEFSVTQKNNTLHILVPSFRSYDVSQPEDIIEEIARVYGYQALPSEIPQLTTSTPQRVSNQFYWENRIKHALKYWGFTEVYTSSFVSETLYEGPVASAVQIDNPLNEDMVYMRRTLVPSLLQVVRENKNQEQIKIFEIANVYIKRENDLPDEIPYLAGVMKQQNISFFQVKGYIEQLLHDLGINHYVFQPLKSGGEGAEICLAFQPIAQKRENLASIGTIEFLDEHLIDFELRFDKLIHFATLKKSYISESKFPPVFEDISLHIASHVLTQDVIEEIKSQSTLIKLVSLLDRYESNRTFHISYQDTERNLTTEDVKEIHEKIVSHLKKKWSAKENS